MTLGGTLRVILTWHSQNSAALQGSEILADVEEANPTNAWRRSTIVTGLPDTCNFQFLLAAFLKWSNAQLRRWKTDVCVCSLIRAPPSSIKNRQVVFPYVVQHLPNRPSTSMWHNQFHTNILQLTSFLIERACCQREQQTSVLYHGQSKQFDSAATAVAVWLEHNAHQQAD